MKTGFFEEFPAKESLSKLKLVKFPTTVYLAARSFKEFQRIKKQIRARAVYWPILKKEEGYWISPFSDTNALKRIFSEIPDNQEVMLDLEFPLKRALLIKNLAKFWKNKKIIENFVRTHNKSILCENFISSWILRIFGLSYNVPKNRIIKMIYTGHGRGMLKLLKKSKAERVGIGCIAGGIYGNEPVLSPEELERDLKILKKKNVREAIIFRLGGLNKEYVRTVNKRGY